jgi:hypothetical protein
MNKVDAITAEAFLPDVVKRYPTTRAVFDRYNASQCGAWQSATEIFADRMVEQVATIIN